MAGAIGRLVLAGKSITALTGYCARVARLDDVLSDLAVSTVPRAPLESSTDLHTEARLAALMTPGSLVEGRGGGVKFEGVNVIAPDRSVLLTDVNVEIPRGTHVIVAGPNGSGKYVVFFCYEGPFLRCERSRLMSLPVLPDVVRHSGAPAVVECVRADFRRPLATGTDIDYLMIALHDVAPVHGP